MISLAPHSQRDTHKLWVHFLVALSFLFSFTSYAQKEAQTAVLSWSTAEEINSDRFEVEHSLNGKNWQMIGSVAARGNSRNTQWYSFTDNNPGNGSNLYRLRMVDRDGSFEITRAKSLEFDITIETAMYPNPVAERLLLKTGDLSQIRRVELYNASGKSVLESETVTADRPTFFGYRTLWIQHFRRKPDYSFGHAGTAMLRFRGWEYCSQCIGVGGD